MKTCPGRCTPGSLPRNVTGGPGSVYAILAARSNPLPAWYMPRNFFLKNYLIKIQNPSREIGRKMAFLIKSYPISLITFLLGTLIRNILTKFAL